MGADRWQTHLPGSLETILAKYATVEEAIAFCDKYNFPGLALARFPLADSTGASVVIEYGQDRVQYVRKTGVHQIATNFVISNVKNGRKVYDIPSLFSIKTHVAHVFDGQRTIPASETLFRVVESSGVEKAVETYHKMKNQFTKIYRYNFSEQEINSLGYMLLRDDKIDEAIAIFKLNVAEHPKSWNVYDSLGEAYMKQGENGLAIENYQKSLELNPNNVNGKDMLKKLSVKK